MSIHLAGTTLAAAQRRANPPVDDAAAPTPDPGPSPHPSRGVTSIYLRELDERARARYALEGAAGEGVGERGRGVDSGGASFERRFAALAADPAAFHALFGKVFGPGHDVTAAETLRTRALGGDFGWLPRVEYVGADVLGGARGAYDAVGDTIYIDAALRGTALGAEVLAEEAGHALDARLNDVDTAGDEGELFRRLSGGEALGAEEIADIRAEDDGGTIVVDGERRDVELWSFKKWAKTTFVDPIKEHVVEPIKEHIVEPVKEYVVRPILESPAGERVLTWVGKRLDGIVTIYDRVVGGTTERGLNPGEISYLRTIYGNSIDYGAIRIEQGGLRDKLGARSNTIKHDIFMSNEVTDENLRDANGNLTPSGREWLQELGHEAMHVWQFEHGGSTYIGGALAAQWVGDGYDLTLALNEGKAFGDMNPEQQGRLAEFIGVAILDDPNGTLTEDGYRRASGIRTLTRDQFQVVQDAHAALLAG